MSKRFINILLFLIFVASTVLASNTIIIHHELDPVLKGEKAHFELNLMAQQSDLYEGRLFYRIQGEIDYRSTALKEEGFTLFTDLETQDLSPGNIEYYFAMQTLDGNIMTYPEFAPEQNPLSFRLVAGNINTVSYQDADDNTLLILSPEPNEVIPQDELLVAISIPNPDLDVDHTRSRLLIDGINVSTILERDANLYTLTPNNMRTGSHNAEFKIFSPDGSLIGKKEWSFRVTTGSIDVSGFQQRTNVFMDNRYQDIARKSDNFFRAGLNWDAKYNDWDFRLMVRGSSDDGYSQQSANRFGGQVAYNFTPRTRMYVKGGDFSGDYDALTFWNRRILGVGVGLNSLYFDLDVSVGQTASAVEGTTTATDTIPGTYKETFLAVRPVFNFGDHVSWGLNLINGKEDPESIKYGNNPKESLVLGTTLNLNFDNNRVRFAGSFQASIKNNDASGEEVDFDTLANKFDLQGSDKDAAEQFINILESTGFLSVTQGLAPIPALAMQFDTYLSYFNNYIKLTYKSIDANYDTPGNPYLLRGLRGFFANDNIRLVNNQLFLNLYFKAYTDNLSQEDGETTNSDIGASLSYFPMQSLPSLTLTFGSQSRKNDADPANPALYREDNSTQRLGVSSNYSFHTGSVINTATVSVSNVVRDDKIDRTLVSAGDTTTFSNNSDFTIFSLALKNKFDSPFTTRFGFSQSSSLFGENAANEYENKITRFYGGIEYIFEKFAGDMDLKPFANFSLSQYENILEYNRLNYTAGFYINSFDYGNLSLRFDYIDFGDRPGTDWQDMILSTRYDVTF